MNYADAVERIYEHVEHGHIDKAAMTCLRIARNLNDHLYIVIFLFELYESKIERLRIFREHTKDITAEARKHIWEKAGERWMESRTLKERADPDIEEKVFVTVIGTIEHDIRGCERSLVDMKPPSGMSPYDTAFFTDIYNNNRNEVQLTLRTLQIIKERVRTLCLDYAVKIEMELESRNRTQHFLTKVQNDVHTYFKVHSDDVYTKLQSATKLIDSDDPESFSLLLTQVRRAIKSAADFFYPASDEPVVCSDGTMRVLSDEKYANRLEEFVNKRMAKSSSRDLLKSELSYFMVFVRRLNDIASKGVHTNASAAEARQGLIGLYLFLHTLCEHLNTNDGNSS